LTGCLTANQVADVMEKTLMQLSAEQKAERAQREETVMAVSTSRSDGAGGYRHSDGSTSRSDGAGGYRHSDGSTSRSDGAGGYRHSK